MSNVYRDPLMMEPTTPSRDVEPRPLRMDGLTLAFDYFDHAGPSVRSLVIRIERGAQTYAGQFGKRPNVVWVHPRNMDGETLTETSGCTIFVTNGILPDHYRFYFDTLADEGAAL